MNPKRILICILSVLLLLQISGCNRIERPTVAPMPSLSPTPTDTPTPASTDAPALTPTPVPILTAAASAGVQRIDPYNFDWYNADLKKLLDETLNGRKIEALQGNERLNAELYTFWITYFFPDRQPSSHIGPKADYYKLGEEVLADVNSDGIKEKVKVEKTNVGSPDYRALVNLTINDQSVELHLQNAVGTYAIVDVDTKDEYKQIIIGEYGPSDDPFSEIFTFDGNKIIDCGGLTGTISPEYQGIDIDGSGSVFCMERTDILQTWHYQAEYKLDEALYLTEVLPAKGFYKTSYPVVILKPFKIYENPDTSSRQFTISDAQSAKLIGIDGQWVLIKAADGVQGWIHADSDHCYNILNGDVSVPSQDLLYDMEFYD